MTPAGARCARRHASRGPLLALAVVLILVVLPGCSSLTSRTTEGPGGTRTDSVIPKPPPSTGARRGGYYLDDGPGANPPANLDAIPDAVPTAEPLRRANMRPYSVMGRTYAPMTELVPYRERGIATWYGRRYHGQRTSSGEVYDMYAMTAAHTTLPIPSYARVTNLRNGRAVVVRINDRGPFHSDRLIDLSYTAAYKLDVLGGGSAWVEVETVFPGEVRQAAPAPSTPPDAGTFGQPGVAGSTAPEPQPRAAAPATPARPSAAGIFLQLGAFGVRENAERFVARLQAELDGVSGMLSIAPGDNVFRVRAGPYASRSEAQHVADSIEQRLGARPIIATP